MIKYRGETFSGYNKAKRTPSAPKSHAVLAKVGDKVKLIRFGQQNVEGAGNKKDAESVARRKSFKARHKITGNESKLSAKFWSNKVKW